MTAFLLYGTKQSLYGCLGGFLGRKGHGKSDLFKYT